MLTDEEFKCFLKALGTRIRTLRKDKNFNMRDIMIATGYYDAQWRKYESGGSMNLMSLMKVAMALDVSLSELFDGLGEWPKRSVAEIELKRGRAAGSDRAESGDDLSAESEAAPKISRKTTKAKRPSASKAGVTTSSAGAQRDRKSAN